MGGTDHAVADGHETTREANHINRVVLRVIIIIVGFCGRDFEGIAAFNVEHRIAKHILCLQRVFPAFWPVLLADGIEQWHLLALTSQVLGLVVVVTKVTEVLIANLLIVQLHRRMVDTVVLCMILHVHTGHRVSIGVLPFALKVVSMRGDGVGQVNHVIHLSVLEQRGIALCRDLLNLPFHRWQFHLVLACVHVGYHFHAVLCGVYLSLIGVFLVVCRVDEDLIANRLLAVGHVEHQSGSVVALQHKHHLQVIAQIVLRERVAQWKSCLVFAAYHTSDECHASVVVEVGVGHVYIDVMLRLLVAVVFVVVSLPCKFMSILHRLDGAVAWQHTEGKLALEVGGHLAAGSVHLTPIHQERHALHRDARAGVHHIAGELYALGDSERHVVAHVLARLAAELEWPCVFESRYAGSYLIHSFMLVGSPIGKPLLPVVAALVGIDQLFDGAATL